MAAVGETFWAEVDKQVVGAGPHRADEPTSARSAPALVAVKGGAEPELVRTPFGTPEWSGVLDLINGARAQAEIQKELLLEQAETFRQTIRELSQEAEAIRQQVRVSEAQAGEAKAEAERQVAKVLAQAEARVRDIQAKADMQIAQARSATQRAEERAAVAEGWLKRIEEAAKTLAPGLVPPTIRSSARLH